MTAPTKIEGLRNLWIGYAAFSAIASLLHGGLHGDAVRHAVIGFVVMAGLAWYCASKLQTKSSLVWAFWVVGAVIGIAIAGLEVVSMFSDGGQFELVPFVRAAFAIFIHVRTFRTLRDADVKRFVMT